MARSKLFNPRIGVTGVVERALRKIEGSADEWVKSTSQGFRENWAVYIDMVARSLAPVVANLPPKTGDVRANILNRALPVAQKISETARQYRTLKIKGQLQPAVITPPAAPRAEVAPPAISRPRRIPI